MTMANSSTTAGILSGVAPLRNNRGHRRWLVRVSGQSYTMSEAHVTGFDPANHVGESVTIQVGPDRQSIRSIRVLQPVVQIGQDIVSATELDNLPGGSVVTDKDGWPWTKHEGRWHCGLYDVVFESSVLLQSHPVLRLLRWGWAR